VIFKRCPLCHQRRPKRDCPALGQTICAVCCATKRQVEISCPPDCPYLSSARAHPAAVVQRRRDRDVRFLLPLIQDLGERQYRLLLAMQATILKHAGSALPPPIDDDVRDAAGTLASTLETARKGIIYEHQTASLPAQRIVGELRRFLGEIERDGPVKGLDGDAATVLRRIEQGARESATAFAEDGDRAYLALLGRVMAETMTGGRAGEDSDQARPQGGLIIP
jgi:hypothetical protein